MNPPLLCSVDKRIATLTINRPETRNDISDAAFVSALEAVCANISADTEICAVIVTGAGTAFSAGGNLKAMQDRSGMFAGDPTALRQGYRNVIHRIPRLLYELDIPTIAAVNGPAIGAGCDLALMCDIRIASEKAKFASSFVKLGLVPGDGGAWLLPRVVGLTRACEMMFTGDTIDAATALSWGLVSAVTAPDRLMDEAFLIARRIADNPARTLRLTKRLTREGLTSTFASAMEMAASYQALAHHTDEHKERLAAMIDRLSSKSPPTAPSSQGENNR